MTVSFVARVLAVGLTACASAAPAQGPASTPAQPQTQAPRAAATTTVPLDRVIAVVNDEALTQWDLREQRRVVLDQLKASNVPAPSAVGKALALQPQPCCQSPCPSARLLISSH